MINERTRKAYKVSKEIATTMNELNYNCFTQLEVVSAIKDYMCMLLSNDKQQLIDVLQSEIVDGNKDIFPLYNEVIIF